MKLLQGAAAVHAFASLPVGERKTLAVPSAGGQLTVAAASVAAAEALPAASLARTPNVEDVPHARPPTVVARPLTVATSTPLRDTV